jgi:hypothetical protein
MVEDSHDKALPRRVRGDTNGPTTGRPEAPVVLPEPVRQQILSVLDGIRAKASQQDLPAQAERTAQNHAAHTERSASSPGCPSAEAPTEPLAAIAASRSGTETESEEAQPDIAAQPGTVAPAPADRELALIRPAKAAPPKARARARTGTSYRLILIAVLLGGSLALVLARFAITAATGEGRRTTTRAEVSIRARAVAWVAVHVSRTAMVSCDEVMCKALAAHGFPPASLLELEVGTADLLRSGIVVSTAAARSMIGSPILTADAPAVIASFGSGNRQISIRVVAPHGAAYLSALRADVRARKASGAALLDNQRVIMSEAAREQLADGQVDSRLLTIIAGLAAQRPVSIVAFGDRGPGASPGIPLRSADLAGTGGTAGAQSAAPTPWMIAFLRAQRHPYRAAHIQEVQLASGRHVLRIDFSAPTMLGLLGSPGAGPAR